MTIIMKMGHKCKRKYGGGISEREKGVRKDIGR
jgi:hypothetical protein